MNETATPTSSQNANRPKCRRGRGRTALFGALFLGRRGHPDLEGVATEVRGDHRGESRVVLDHQDPDRHAPIIGHPER